MITIDGSQGEGGGQILRTALTLSAVTGRPFRIQNIRANRPKPGLQPQHVKSVEAAARVCQARTTGNALDSTELTFEPGEITPGEYRFDIGTAGSVALVLQTVFVPLSLAGSSSRVEITGGTHVPWAPAFDYLELVWLPFMQRLGYDAELKLERAGFYPRGGGKVTGHIHPAGDRTGLTLLQRGSLKQLYGISGYARLSRSVAERQKRRAESILRDRRYEASIRITELAAPSPGTILLLLAVFEFSLCGYFALGARGKPAETVAEEAAQAFLAFTETNGVVDEYLADQLLIPLALVETPSEFRVPKVTRHLLTNRDVISHFLDTPIRITGELGQEGTVAIGRP